MEAGDPGKKINSASCKIIIISELFNEEAKKNQAVLTVVDVVPDRGLPGEPVSRELQDFVAADHRNTLKSMLRSYEKCPSMRVDVRIGKAVIELIRAVIKNGHDLVIKPAEKPA